MQLFARSLARRAREDQMQKTKRMRKGRLWSLATSVPELTILILLIVGGYLIMGIFSRVEGTEALSPSVMFVVQNVFETTPVNLALLQ